MNKDILEGIKKDMESLINDNLDVMKTSLLIINEFKKGAELDDAFNKYLRSYEVALKKCLEEGATFDKEFQYAFTCSYIYNVLNIISNIVSIDVLRNPKNKDFVKRKINECLSHLELL